MLQLFSKLKTSIKTLIALIICHKLVGKIISKFFNDQIPSRGCVISTRNNSITSTTKAYLFWGMYESAEARFIKKYLRDDLDVIELGSSIGVIASYIGKQIQSSRRMICVEANPNLIESIDINLKQNAPNINRVIRQAAIDYVNSSAYVNLIFGDSNVTSKIGAADPTKEGCLVAKTRLGDLVAEHRLGAYSLVCDIEGAEAGILQYDRDALSNCQQLIIELHDTILGGQKVTINQMVETCRQQGFTLRDMYGSVFVFNR